MSSKYDKYNNTSKLVTVVRDDFKTYKCFASLKYHKRNFRV